MDGIEETQMPCSDKIAFDTLKQAQTAATVAGHQHGAKLKAYRCRYCHLYHLSSS